MSSMQGVTGPFSPNSLALLDRALRWWRKNESFVFVDLPWLVPSEFSDATRPSFCQDIRTPRGSLVASGEQSFLQLWTEGRLPEGKGYIGWTPCFRDESYLDKLHQHAFMKAEWFVPFEHDATNSYFFQLVAKQLRCFGELAKAMGVVLADDEMQLRAENNVMDIELNGIELGSYGIREFQGRPYIFGTALALPRFEVALADSRTDANPGPTLH